MVLSSHYFFRLGGGDIANDETFAAKQMNLFVFERDLEKGTGQAQEKYLTN
jgi:hypothetical protein